MSDPMCHGRPAIALLVPCYNGVAFIDEFSECIAKLTVPFDEVIFFDDGSTDGSGDKLRQKGFRVIGGGANSGGCAYPRNCLMDATRCDFFHFHDIDDPIHPRFVELMLPHLNPRSISFCNYEKTESGKIVYVSNFEQSDVDPDPISFFIRNFVQFNAIIFSTEVRVLRLERELRLYSDKIYPIAIAASGYNFRVVTSVLATWRVRPGSTMTSKTWGDANYYFGRFLQLLPTLNDNQAQDLMDYAISKCWQSYYESQELSYIEEIADALHRTPGRSRLYASNEGRAFNTALTLFGLSAALWLKRQWSRLRTIPNLVS